MPRTLIAAAAALCAFATTGIAQAESVSVKTADLDLATAEGQTKLDARIASAVRKVCSGPSTDSRIQALDATCAANARVAIERQVAALRTTSRIGG